VDDLHHPWMRLSAVVEMVLLLPAVVATAFAAPAPEVVPFVPLLMVPPLGYLHVNSMKLAESFPINSWRGYQHAD